MNILWRTLQDNNTPFISPQSSALFPSNLPQYCALCLFFRRKKKTAPSQKVVHSCTMLHRVLIFETSLQRKSVATDVLNSTKETASYYLSARSYPYTSKNHDKHSFDREFSGEWHWDRDVGATSETRCEEPGTKRKGSSILCVVRAFC